MYRIAFIGSGDLACGVLQGLLCSEHEIVGVLPWERLTKCSWRMRLKRMLMSDMVALIDKHQLPKIAPCKANSALFLQQMQTLAPDILLVTAWGEILKEEAIGAAKVACINVHPSLLPRHRGFNPIASVLCAGEQQSGLTYHHLTAAIDAGDILLQSVVDISDDDNGDSLKRKIAYRAKETVAEALAKLGDARFTPIKQDEALACYHPKMKQVDALLDWGRPARVLHNQIRGCYPWFQAHTAHRGNKLLVLSSEVIDLHQPVTSPGEILYKTGTQLVVATGDTDKALLLTSVLLAKAIAPIKSKIYIARNVQMGDRLQ